MATLFLNGIRLTSPFVVTGTGQREALFIGGSNFFSDTRPTKLLFYFPHVS
jgi:hypothetical protein